MDILGSDFDDIEADRFKIGEVRVRMPNESGFTNLIELQQREFGAVFRRKRNPATSLSVARNARSSHSAPIVRHVSDPYGTLCPFLERQLEYR